MAPGAVILLDTHVWLRWAEGTRPLSQEQLGAIDDAAEGAGGVLVSAVSVWEIGLLLERNRIALPSSLNAWVLRSLQSAGLRMLALSWEDAAASTALPGNFHTDPSDRFLVAIARRLSVPLVTDDGLIRAYPHVQTI